MTENDKVPNQQRAEKMTEIEEDQFIGIVLKYFTTIESKTTASGITAGTESSNNTKKQNGWIKIQDEFVKQTSVSRFQLSHVSRYHYRSKFIKFMIQFKGFYLFLLIQSIAYFYCVFSFRKIVQLNHSKRNGKM